MNPDIDFYLISIFNNEKISCSYFQKAYTEIYKSYSQSRNDFIKKIIPMMIHRMQSIYEKKKRDHLGYRAYNCFSLSDIDIITSGDSHEKKICIYDEKDRIRIHHLLSIILIQVYDKSIRDEKVWEMISFMKM